MAGAMNAPMTASVQWFERTLDDSANRRVSLPEAFLACDAALRAMAEVAGGLRVNERIVARAVADYLPFLATENLLMEGVRRGGDRQALHELIPPPLDGGDGAHEGGRARATCSNGLRTIRLSRSTGRRSAPCSTRRRHRPRGRADGGVPRLARTLTRRRRLRCRR